MEDKLLKLFRELGNAYEVLGIQSENPSKKEIKKAYKKMALINHPDKNQNDKNASEKFQKVVRAYEILSNQDSKQQYDQYLISQKEQHHRYFEQNAERRKFAEDLFNREQKAKDDLKNELKKKMEQDIKKNEQIIQLQKEQEELEKEKQKKKEIELQQQMETAEFWQKINSIKVKWSKKNQVSYSKELLQMIFKVYGPIKDIAIFTNKSCSIIEFMTREAADQAYLQNQKAKKDLSDSENDEEDSDKQNHLFSSGSRDINDTLKVKYVMKKKKRNEMLQQLEQIKKKQKQSKLESEESLDLNSDTLNKLAFIQNRTSTVYQGTQLDEIKRQQQRQKLIEQLLQQEKLNIN